MTDDVSPGPTESKPLNTRSPEELAQLRADFARREQLRQENRSRALAAVAHDDTSRSPEELAQLRERLDRLQRARTTGVSDPIDLDSL